jgi:predicted nucleic acid-binding protein
MEIVADASAFLAVVLDETDREWIIEKTFGYAIVSPEVLPYEIANALIAARKRGRLTDSEVTNAFELSQRIPVKLIPVSVGDAVGIAIKCGIYAYDAFYLQCCLETTLPLISLDNKMCDVAESLGISVVR